MTDRFGTFVVFTATPEGKRIPLSIETTEADARGEAHEVAMTAKGSGNETDYLEIPLKCKAIVRLALEGHDTRSQLAGLSEDEFAAFELYFDARSNAVFERCLNAA